MAQAPIAVVVCADLHINSTVAICPETVRLDDGGTYQPSNAQRWLNDRWREFWAAVANLHRSELYVVICGDIVEGNHHRTTQIVTGNEETQSEMALAILEPIANLADYLFVVRGTEAHTGPSSMWEEQIGKALGAEPDPSRESHSWWHLLLTAGGVRFDISHHPQTTSRVPYLRGSAASRQAAITWAEYHEMGESPPDVVVRGHVHGYACGYHDDVLGIMLPSWQLRTAYGYRKGGGRRIDPPGGAVFQCQNARYSWQAVRYRPQLGPGWTSPKQS